MSFTEQVKNELARIPREDAGSRAAELLALLRMSGCLVVDSRLKFFQTVVFYVFIFRVFSRM